MKVSFYLILFSWSILSVFMLNADRFATTSPLLLMLFVDESVYTEFLSYWKLKEASMPIFFQFQHHFHHIMSYFSYLSMFFLGDSFFSYRLPAFIAGFFSISILAKCISIGIASSKVDLKASSRCLYFITLLLFPVLGVAFAAKSISMYPQVFNLLMLMTCIYLFSTFKKMHTLSFLIALVTSFAFIMYPSNLFLIPSFFIPLILYELKSFSKNDLQSTVYNICFPYIIGVLMPILFFHIYLKVNFSIGFLDAFYDLNKMFGYRSLPSQVHYPFNASQFIFNIASSTLMFTALLGSFFHISTQYIRKGVKKIHPVYFSSFSSTIFYLFYLQTANDPAVHAKNFPLSFLCAILLSFLCLKIFKSKDKFNVFLDLKYSFIFLSLPVIYLLAFIPIGIIKLYFNKYFLKAPLIAFIISLYMACYLINKYTRPAIKAKIINFFKNSELTWFYYILILTFLHIIITVFIYQLAYFNKIFYNSSINIIISLTCFLLFSSFLWLYLKRKISGQFPLYTIVAFLLIPDAYFSYKYLYSNIGQSKEIQALASINKKYKGKGLINSLNPVYFDFYPVLNFYNPKYFVERHSPPIKQKILSNTASGYFCIHWGPPPRYYITADLLLELKESYKISEGEPFDYFYTVYGLAKKKLPFKNKSNYKNIKRCSINPVFHKRDRSFWF